MKADWFFPGRLALRLARNQVSNQEVAMLILASYVFGLMIAYGAFVRGNDLWTFLYLLEFVVMVLITLIGFTKCYDAAGGNDNPDFAKHFCCLSFGTWVWTTVGVWVIYWIGFWLFTYGMFAQYDYRGLGISKNLELISASFGWLWTFIAQLAWQGIFFLWLASCLRKFWKARAAALDAG